MQRVRLKPAYFSSDVVCLGAQIAQTGLALERVLPGLAWFATDMAVAEVEVGDVASLRGFGRTSDLTAWLEPQGQFTSGVFFAVGSDGGKQQFRADASTDDPEWSSLGEAEFEVRAFDCSWLEITSKRGELLKGAFPNAEVEDEPC